MHAGETLAEAEHIAGGQIGRFEADLALVDEVVKRGSAAEPYRQYGFDPLVHEIRARISSADANAAAELIACTYFSSSAGTY